MTTKQLDKIDREAEAWAFEAFATAHPHEAYATWPDRFWQFFHSKRPGVTRQQMEQVLKETENEEVRQD